MGPKSTKRHQSNIIDITLLPPSLSPYLFHTPLQSPYFNPKQTNADIVGISWYLKSNKIYLFEYIGTGIQFGYK